MSKTKSKSNRQPVFVPLLAPETRILNLLAKAEGRSMGQQARLIIINHFAAQKEGAK